MCNKCNHKHKIGYQCQCECHKVYYGKLKKEEKKNNEI
jgi:hypothetical protein